MTIVHKHTIDHGDHIINLPSSASVFAVGVQNEKIVMWELHEVDDKLSQLRTFRVVMTGEQFEVNTSLGIIGTVQLKNGLVFHIFEVFASI